MATTTNYGFEKPVVGANEDTWGDLLNSNWDALDTLLGGVSTTEFAILDGATVTTAELNILDGVTATTAEINYVDGVTSAIQTQLDGKQPLDAGLTALAGTMTAANKIPYATDADTAGELDFKDEDDMASDSATAVPSQQSVKAYVDAPNSGRDWVELETFDLSTTPDAESSDFEDGYEYMVQVRNVSYDSTNNRAGVQLYKETGAAYSGLVYLTDQGNDATGDDSWCQCHITLARTSTTFRVFDAVGTDDANLSGDDSLMSSSGNSQPVTFVRWSSADKIGKVKFDVIGAGAVASGEFVIFRRKL